MKNLLVAGFLVLFCSSVFAEECGPEGCVGDSDGQVSLFDSLITGDKPDMLDDKGTQALAYGCFSMNRQTLRYGASVSFNLQQAFNQSLQRCRAASGFPFGLLCQRPVCIRILF